MVPPLGHGAGWPVLGEKRDRTVSRSVSITPRMLAILPWSLLFPFQFGPEQFLKRMWIKALSVGSRNNAV